MSFPYPPSPTNSDESWGVGRPGKYLKASTCNLLHFHAQTYPEGENLDHNLWFHETWTGFDAPLHILFAEDRNGKAFALILNQAPNGEAKSTITISPPLPFHAKDRNGKPSTGTRNWTPSVMGRFRRFFQWGGVALEIIKFFLVFLGLLVCVGFAIQQLEPNAAKATNPLDNQFGTPLNSGDHPSGTWSQPEGTPFSFDSPHMVDPNQPTTEIKSFQSSETTVKDQDNGTISSIKKLNQFIIRLTGGSDYDEQLEKVMQGLAGKPAVGSIKGEEG